MNLNRSFAFATLAVASLSAIPSLAQTTATPTAMNCSEMSMKTANDSMMKMTDPAKKTAAMKEMDMAKDMMAKKDDNGCKMHMDKAMGMMK